MVLNWLTKFQMVSYRCLNHNMQTYIIKCSLHPNWGLERHARILYIITASQYSNIYNDWMTLMMAYLNHFPMHEIIFNFISFKPKQILNISYSGVLSLYHNSASKVHGASMGPTWDLSAPDGPHVGPMNLAFGEVLINMICGNKMDVWLPDIASSVIDKVIYLLTCSHLPLVSWVPGRRFQAWSASQLHDWRMTASVAGTEMGPLWTFWLATGEKPSGLNPIAYTRNWECITKQMNKTRVSTWFSIT